MQSIFVVAAAQPVVLLAGLGNPGARYAETRHNVGHWFIHRLQRDYPLSLRYEKKFKANTGVFQHGLQTIRVLLPDTFMNLSGQSVAPMAAFYRVKAEQILVIHDELDLPPGAARLKCGGGHGGHNGLRDIIRGLGTNEFIRLRIGIGHPGVEREVSNYVLSRPEPPHRARIDQAVENAIAVLPKILVGEWEEAMNRLHSPAAGN